MIWRSALVQQVATIVLHSIIYSSTVTIARRDIWRQELTHAIVTVVKVDVRPSLERLNH